jgi:uncharacterized protein
LSREQESRFYFCRFTQIGLLRLLATSSVMGKDVCTIGEAWKVYDRWLEDSRIGIHHEPFGLDSAFRSATRPVSRQSSPKALGDCYLLAISQVANATLVTFDRGLASACHKARQRVALLEGGDSSGASQ